MSDTTRNIVSAIVTLRRSRVAEDLRRLLELARTYGAGEFVVDLDDTEGPRAQATQAFVRNLPKATPLPVVYWSGAFRCWPRNALLEADLSRKRRAEVVDKVAATLIVHGALDRRPIFTNHHLPIGHF